MSGIIMTHVGLAVKDLKASQHFFVDTFGFVETFRMDITPAFAPMLGLEEAAGEIVMLRLGDKLIELIGHRNPVGSAKKPMNGLGLTHMAFNVPDVDEVAKKVEKNGGTVNWDTRLEIQAPDELRQYIFCSDPDGNHVELIKGTPRG